MNPTTQPNMQQQANDYAGQAATDQAGYPGFQAQTMQGNINAAGLPQASQQESLDFNTFSQMFQNDPYGQQYMANSANFNNAGSVGSPTGTSVPSTMNTATPDLLKGIVPNAPNLTAPTVTSTLPQLTPQNIGQGFQGFTNPVYAAQAGTQNLSNIAGVMNAIQGLIGNNWTAAQGASNQTDQNQLAKIQALMNLASFYQTGANQQAAGSGGSASQAQLQQQTATSIKSEAQKGATIQQLMQKYVPENADADTVLQIYKLYNKGKGKGQIGHGDPIESLQDLQSQYGINPKNFGTTTTAAAQAKQTATEQTKIGALKGMSDMINAYYDGVNNLGGSGIHVYNDQNLLGGSNLYGSQKDIYITALKKALSASKSQASTDMFTKNLPGEISGNPDSSFKGHLTQVMDSNQMRLVVRDGQYYVIGYGDYDKNKDTPVDVSTLPMNTVRQILSSL